MTHLCFFGSGQKDKESMFCNIIIVFKVWVMVVMVVVQDPGHLLLVADLHSSCHPGKLPFGKPVHKLQ